MTKFGSKYFFYNPERFPNFSGRARKKSGDKIVRNIFTIADRKAKLAELKAKSRYLKCGIIGHWAGDIACKFSGDDNGFKGAAIPTPSDRSFTPAIKPAVAKP